MNHLSLSLSLQWTSLSSSLSMSSKSSSVEVDPVALLKVSVLTITQGFSPWADASIIIQIIYDINKINRYDDSNTRDLSIIYYI